MSTKAGLKLIFFPLFSHFCKNSNKLSAKSVRKIYPQFYPQNLSTIFIRKIYPQFSSAKSIRNFYPQFLSAKFIRKIYPQNLSAKSIRKTYSQNLSATFIRNPYPHFLPDRFPSVKCDVKSITYKHYAVMPSHADL